MFGLSAPNNCFHDFLSDLVGHWYEYSCSWSLALPLELECARAGVAGSPVCMTIIYRIDSYAIGARFLAHHIIPTRPETADVGIALRGLQSTCCCALPPQVGGGGHYGSNSGLLAQDRTGIGIGLIRHSSMYSLRSKRSGIVEIKS